MILGGLWWSRATSTAPAGATHQHMIVSLQSLHHHAHKLGRRVWSLGPFFPPLTAQSTRQTLMNHPFHQKEGAAAKGVNRKKKSRIPLTRTAAPAFKKNQTKPKTCMQTEQAFEQDLRDKQAKTGICKGRRKITPSVSTGEPSNSSLAGPASPERTVTQKQLMPASLQGKRSRSCAWPEVISHSEKAGPLHTVISETEADNVNSQRGNFWYVARTEMILQVKDY